MMNEQVHALNIKVERILAVTTSRHGAIKHQGIELSQRLRLGRKQRHLVQSPTHRSSPGPENDFGGSPAARKPGLAHHRDDDLTTRRVPRGRVQPRVIRCATRGQGATVESSGSPHLHEMFWTCLDTSIVRPMLQGAGKDEEVLLTPERSEALSSLYEQCSPRVLAYALRRTSREQAEEVLAETFIVAWRRLNEIPDDPIPWLLAVARRVLANQRRATSRREALDQRLQLALGAGTEFWT